jgi:pyruvate formate lyase activating enzyme
MSGAVFNIQRFSLHDGPGIRTTVFLKGCTLNCFWCHNPEGRRVSRELQFFSERCVACGVCVEACPHDVHEFVDGIHILHRDRCHTTGHCVASCYAQALQFSGTLMTVGEVMTEVLRDEMFYKNSGGGVTLSGGEPSLHHSFASEILGECKRQGIHTALETCGECPWETLESLLPLTDLVMMDIKLLDGPKHRAVTGRSNERILANARRLAQTNIPLLFRTPVVPTVNDAVGEIEEIAAFLRTLRELRRTSLNGNGTDGIAYELLTFHRLASDKYRSLGLEYKASAFDPPPAEQMKKLAEAAERNGIRTTIR